MSGLRRFDPWSAIGRINPRPGAEKRLIAPEGDRPFAYDPIERAAIQAEGHLVQRRRKRSPAWTATRDEPQPGDYCERCAASIWWTEARDPCGWCCAWCHPPDHLRPDEIRTTAT